MTPLRLRLFHAADGTRVAYREAGVGPGLVLLHSAGLSHREFEPVVEHLTHRFRLILPDLPLHGDSEDRPRHPYTLDWFAEVMAAFCVDTAGPRPLVAGHGAGAQVLLRAVANGHAASRAARHHADAACTARRSTRPGATWCAPSPARARCRGSTARSPTPRSSPSGRSAA